MKFFSILFLSIFSFTLKARPVAYTELVKYVQMAPDQGNTGTCLYVASTGAMELLANKKNQIENPMPGGKFDLAESFLIHAPNVLTKDKSWFEKPIYRFNNGFGIHITSWPFDPWDDGVANPSVWTKKEMDQMVKVPLFPIETKKLFEKGMRYSTNVLNQDDVAAVKEALWTYKAPVVINYNDNNYWHVVVIVGYDNKLKGDCYQITANECAETEGSFYVRDSFGPTVEIRDYDWFKVKGNAAFLVTEKGQQPSAENIE